MSAALGCVQQGLGAPGLCAGSPGSGRMLTGCCHSCTELPNPSLAEQGPAQGRGTCPGSVWDFGRECGDTGRGLCTHGGSRDWVCASPQKQMRDVQQRPLKQLWLVSGCNFPRFAPAPCPAAFPVTPVSFHLQSRKGRGRMSWLLCSSSALGRRIHCSVG